MEGVGVRQALQKYHLHSFARDAIAEAGSYAAHAGESTLS